MGRDATLNWPTTDLKWRNDSPYGIYITSRATPSTLTFTFWSTSRGYKVTSSTSSASNFRAPATRYKDDPTLPKGKEVVEESGSSGFDVTVSRTVTKGGSGRPARQLRLQLQPLGPGRPPRHRRQGGPGAGSRPARPEHLGRNGPGGDLARWARLCLATSGPAPAVPR